MTAKDFNLIKSIDHRANIVWDYGEFIDEKIIYHKYQIKMYSLYSFIVEVWVNVKTLQIEKISALEEFNDWSGYMNLIRFEEILTHAIWNNFKSLKIV